MSLNIDDSLSQREVRHETFRTLFAVPLVRLLGVIDWCAGSEQHDAMIRLVKNQVTIKLMNRKALYLLFLSVCIGQTACNSPHFVKPDYLGGYAALTEDGLANVIIEIPAGTNDKWMVDKTSGSLSWEQENGTPRVVQYLAYPANYGMIPRTALPYALGGDGDPLDVLVMGPRVERGTALEARPVGVLRLLDDGERDDKILAVRSTGPLSDVNDLDQLASKYPGILVIIETWFENYKGPDRVISTGFGSAAEALEIIQEASRYYDENGIEHD